MPSVPRRLHRVAVASTVVSGFALLGMSVAGIAAMQTDLEAATRPAPPSRLVEEASPAVGDHDCRRPAPPTRTEPGV